MGEGGIWGVIVPGNGRGQGEGWGGRGRELRGGSPSYICRRGREWVEEK